MSADVLRRAASLMRERANGARSNNPWMVDSDRPNVVLDPDKPNNDWDGLTVCEVPLADDGLVDFPTVEHIASWHPAVAHAVADWLDAYADQWSEAPEVSLPEDSLSLTVARAYIGEQS